MIDDEALDGWLALLETSSYYDLLGVSASANFDELQAAFHAFANTFHPDGHMGRPEGERAAIGTIFKHGTAAYAVLSDSELRARYDAALARGELHPDLSATTPSNLSRARAASAGGTHAGRRVDAVRTQAARPFVVRAEELAKKGDVKQATLQLVMAMHLDPKNEALEAFAKELEERARKR